MNSDPKASCYAEGGEVDSDSEAMLDQCAMECIDAVEKKDKKGFRDGLNVLVADLLNKMQAEPKE